MVTLSVVVVMVYETIRIYCIVLPSIIEQSSLLISLLECRLFLALFKWSETQVINAKRK